MTCPRDLLMDGAHADEFTSCCRDVLHYTSSLELTNCLSGAEKLAREIDADDFVPLFKRHVMKRRIPLQSGIVHHDVQSSKPTYSAGEHRLDVLLVADV